MAFIERIRDMLRKKQPVVEPHTKIKAKITKEFLSLNDEERNEYLNRAFDVEYCKKVRLFDFKIEPPQDYFRPINELIAFNDEEEFEKFLNLI